MQNKSDLTISDVKYLLSYSNDNRYFFSERNMNYFNQTLDMFKIKKLSSNEYLIYAPSFWRIDGKLTLMGITQRIYNINDNELYNVPDELQITEEQLSNDSL